MDGAQAYYLYPAVGAKRHTRRRVGGRGGLFLYRKNIAEQPLLVRVGEAAAGADLGGSSKYSNENFED